MHWQFISTVPILRNPLVNWTSGQKLLCTAIPHVASFVGSL